MNDGPQNPGQPDPEEMAEQLRRMMQQLGLPANGDFASFMTQLSQMFGGQVGFGMPGADPSSGPVDWSHIKDMARHITASHGPDPTPGQQERIALLDASRLAESWLDRECEFAQVSTQPACWSRAEWIEHTFSSWQSVVEPVLVSLTEAMSGLMSSGEPNDPMAALTQMMGPVLRRMSAMLYGAQLAQGLGELSTSTVTGTEIGLQVLSVPQVILLPTNIAAAWNDLDLDPRDVELYLVLRESARQRLFNAVSWLGPQLLALVEHYAREIRIDSSAIEDAINIDDLSQLTPEKAQEMSEHLQGRLFEPTRTPEQEGVLERLETLLALIEGWVDEVTSQVARTWLPSHDQLAEAVRRRRATSGPAEVFFQSLLGLELRPRRVRDAANLWAALRDARGTVGRDQVWNHPDIVPTTADLDDPLGYVSGERQDSAEGGDDLDAELEELLRDHGQDE
ncbi:zinc-dependent metalloprotease [Cutibacterium sp.]|uniref:zinc-dependent metalloprotease n=1 Tax=Cutibacterium sp. TaxID=1912221 RepID=UPI0026DD1676|nr:zinc-dependent metalloprotease [Cutibacterium sp.]MDO4412067.1 zinc-dependent metalloprotease [Cutibacterium sp.]